MRIAIIGATGMLGHHSALAAQAAGHELVLLHRPNSNLTQLAGLAGERRVATLGNQPQMDKALDGVDMVINCAAYYPGEPRHWKAEVETATEQMQAFYKACAKHPLKKIVYLGGAIALPKTDDGSPAHADLSYKAQPSNRNAYLQVKWAMDQQALLLAQQGMPIVVGIPSMTFGEYDYGPSTGQFITQVANRSLPAYVPGNRNVIYAGDAGRGLLACAEHGRPGERYLLTGSNTNMDELLAQISQLTGSPMPKPLPLWLAKTMNSIQTVAYKMGGPVPKVSETAIAVMSAGQHLDGSKAERELGFTAEVSMADALSKALAWFKAEGYC